MRWIVIGMVLATALIVTLAVVVGMSSGNKKHRAPRVPKDSGALVLYRA
jgi:hypothetical protein